MASTLMPSLSLLLLLLIITMGNPSEAQQDHPRLSSVRQVMIDKGYEDMAEMLVSMHSVLFPDLEILEMENKTYTVFAPGTPSFWARSNDDPPLSLVSYHIVPYMVDRDLLESTSMFEHKIDTLLQGHPLVVTTGSPEGWTSLPSLNLVPIVEWDVYNDGHLIVHGLPEFFNPDYQTTEYPWFDGPETPVLSPTAAQVSNAASSIYFRITSQSVFSFLFPILVCLLFLNLLLVD